MNAIKTLLAASILCTAGIASATTVGTFNATVSGGVPGISFNGTGTGVLDDSGTLTLTLADVASGTIVATVNESTVFTGTYGGGVFTATGGAVNFSNCVGSPLCPAVPTTPIAMTGVTGSVTPVAGGTASGGISVLGIAGTMNYSLAPQAPAVPIPAAAWLFGTGLSGLAGIARRRRNAANAA